VIYHLIVIGLLSWFVLTIIINYFSFRTLGRYGAGVKFGEDAPLVSVLVPARNEANNIARCLRSLLAQDYPNFEIIVLNDNSTDATPAIAEMLGKDDLKGRLRLADGGELADGWLGKNFACHQLYQLAQGDYLLFTDADTVHGVRSISCGMAALEQEKADLLSVFPRQQTDSLAERLAVPLMTMFVVGLLPIWLVKRSKNPAFSAANGQFMFFRREAYEAIGGHSAVRNKVLEDVILGRRIKQAGFRQVLPDGSDTITCRMYRNFSEVWSGFSKNLFAFFNYKLIWFLLFGVINFCGFVLPYFLLLYGWIAGFYPSAEWLWFPIAQIILAWLVRGLLAVRFGYRLIDFYLHPFSIIFMLIIGYNSIQWHNKGTQWKGRTYMAKSRSR
jgi:chlorobactene glucosyltransferase